jgi:ankyrin repeat protein
MSRFKSDCYHYILARSYAGVFVLQYSMLLIDHRATVNRRSDKDETPLDSAAAYGIVRFLTKSGAAVSAQDNNGWTPFHTASNFRHLHIMNFFLLECSIDVDIWNECEERSLYLASSPGELDAARFLRARRRYSC